MAKLKVNVKLATKHIGKLYLGVFEKDEFAKKTDAKRIGGVIHEISQSDFDGLELEFEIPNGEYAIKCQIKDNDDSPQKAWGVSGSRTMFGPVWDKSKFVFENDMTVDVVVK